MNLVHPQLRSCGTLAAEGFPRRAFTVHDVLRMQEAGVLDEDERFELIEGEIVPMQSKNYPHERIKLGLNRALTRALPDSLQLGVETSLFLSSSTILEPDLSIFPMMDTTEVRASDILLVVEVADTTLDKDIRLKAAVYAKYGVRELWVIDANRLETHVHRDPVDGKWNRIEILGPDLRLTHPAAPGFAVRLADFQGRRFTHHISLPLSARSTFAPPPRVSRCRRKIVSATAAPERDEEKWKPVFRPLSIFRIDRVS